MEIKYEAVFGDQSLFYDAQSDCEMVGNGHHKIENGIVKVWNFTEKQWADNYKQQVTIVAMRRIIRTPTWSVADQKAGKLPEVSCRVNFCHKLNANWRTGEIKYIDDQVVVIKTDDVARPFVYEVERVEFKPIESQEEKAARLREEWVDKATFMKTYEIYDQLLSGDLPVPVKEQP